MPIIVKRCSFVLLASFILTSALFPDDALTLRSKVSVGFGEDKQRLGIMRQGNDTWSPLFFTVLEDGSVAIPDYYKNRIAIFSETGAYLREIPVEGILSPRMNYFGGGESGVFIVFNDSVLYCLSESGEPLWNIPFPLGVFPHGVYATRNAVSFSIPNAEGTAQGVTVSIRPPYDVVDATCRDGALSIPFIRLDSARYGYIYSDTLNLAKLSGGVSYPDAIPGDARYLTADDRGNSVWGLKEGASFKIWVLNMDGTISLLGEIDLEGDASWYWAESHISEDQVLLYVHQPGTNSIEITIFQGIVKR